MTTTRTVTASALLLLGALALAGCATTPAGSAAPSDPAAAPASSAPGDDSELDAAWLSGGAAIGLVTYGSSTCLPIVGEVSGSGQTVSVELTAPDAAACTMDYVPRASYIPVPEGVDTAQDVEVVVSGAYRGDTDLDALAGAEPPASDADDPMVDMQPSAGWFDDGGLVLLTFGSSSCPPVFESVALAADGTVDARIAQPDADRVCTADFGPQLSVLQVEGVDDDALPAEIVVTDPAGAEPQRIAILG